MMDNDEWSRRACATASNKPGQILSNTNIHTMHTPPAPRFLYPLVARYIHRNVYPRL